ncbi:MAG TPA: ATP synthase F1 subunit delta [Methylomirabilota bacterium]|nr:ATP synthase F1 subunit delta [Methylomirabilota bacterium]
MKAIAERYAGALADVAIEKGEVPRIQSELKVFREMADHSHELRLFLANPAVLRAGKHAVIGQLAERMGSSRTLRNFLFLLVDHGRTSLLPDIEASFEHLLDARLGVTRAEVTSADELSSTDKGELTKVIEKLTGSASVNARFRTDSALVGGAIVRVGSKVYDGSVRTQLNALRIRLAAE